MTATRAHYHLVDPTGSTIVRLSSVDALKEWTKAERFKLTRRFNTTKFHYFKCQLDHDTCIERHKGHATFITVEATIKDAQRKSMTPGKKSDYKPEASLSPHWPPVGRVVTEGPTKFIKKF